MVLHTDNALVLHTPVLGVAPSADALSAQAHGPHRPPSWRYGLAARLVSALTAATYLVAGVAEVRGPLRWSWARGESLRSQVAADGLCKELLGSAAAPLGIRLHRRTGLFRLLATGSLLVELGAPPALLHPRRGRASLR